MERKVLDTADFSVTETGHDYDFARFVENKTDHPLYFIFDENNSDWDYADNSDELAYAHYVYKSVSKDEFDDNDNTDNFVVEPHDWIGLFGSQFVEI